MLVRRSLRTRFLFSLSFLAGSPFWACLMASLGVVSLDLPFQAYLKAPVCI